MTVDTPAPYTLAELNDQLDGEMGRLDNQSSLGPLQKLKGRLAAVQSDPRYGFMFPSEIFLIGDLAAILGQLFRVPADGRPICRLDFSEISSEILNVVVVAVVGRLAFSLAVSIGQKTPLLLICEEAHRYAPQDAALGFEPAKRSLARIAELAPSTLPPIAAPRMPGLRIASSSCFTARSGNGIVSEAKAPKRSGLAAQSSARCSFCSATMRAPVSRSVPYQNGLIDRISMSIPISSIERSRPSTPLRRKCTSTPFVGGTMFCPAPPISESASSKMQ